MRPLFRTDSPRLPPIPLEEVGPFNETRRRKMQCSRRRRRRRETAIEAAAKNAAVELTRRGERFTARKAQAGRQRGRRVSELSMRGDDSFASPHRFEVTFCSAVASAAPTSLRLTFLPSLSLSLPGTPLHCLPAASTTAVLGRPPAGRPSRRDLRRQHLEF